jgi:anti-sigma B factor antagonist
MVLRNHESGKTHIPADNSRLQEFAIQRETPMILNVQSKKVEPDIAILELTGRITMGNDSQQIEWGLAELLKGNHKKVIFDLTEVTFLDSSGIGILMMCYAKLKKAGGALRIAGARGMVEEALDMTSVNKIVRFYPTAAEAAQGFQLA